jgi:hypothetical protein
MQYENAVCGMSSMQHEHAVCSMSSMQYAVCYRIGGEEDKVLPYLWCQDECRASTALPVVPR